MVTPHPHTQLANKTMTTTEIDQVSRQESQDHCKVDTNLTLHNIVYENYTALP